MKNSLISIAVIGYGYWGPNLIRNFQETEGAHMKMCCDLDLQRLSRAKARSPALETTTDYEQVLKNPAIDAVAIATPVHTHYGLAKSALEHGKHVLVEKPM